MNLRQANRRPISDPPSLPADEKSLFVSKSCAARLTGLSERSIDLARARGELASIKYGRRVLFRREDLVGWLESKKVG